MWRHIYSPSVVCTQRWRHASAPRAARLISGSGKEIARFHILRSQKLKKTMQCLAWNDELVLEMSKKNNYWIRFSQNSENYRGLGLCYLSYFFFAFLWTETKSKSIKTQKKNLTILTEQAWSIKDLLYGQKITPKSFSFARTKREIRTQDSLHLARTRS